MIEFKQVSKQYENGIWAVKKVSFQIKTGEFVYLVGPSGSGKSTLMKLMNRQELASKGQINIDDFDVTNIKAKQIPLLRRHVGVVFQDFRLLPKYTVAENIAYALEVTGKSRKEIKQRVEEVLDIVRLKAKMHQLPQELSGGEQQRVAIARALANRPLILLADEPTGNLDPTNAVEIMHALERVNREGTTVLMGTHNDSIVNSHPHRILQMYQGELVRDLARGGR
ncbi:cell division ATP-binding protein FtsE [Facklamia sp. DSM 111018]|uniref:Cell division ATP-binding protein FtsE n=1 Tax=Facklamia lactis TaxID=2749967 RepID=A0ABS0LSZ3_9LACT|nr:cell division ATP-binding protein FtsE [Facklamia lactis]MBG9981447.1 cell division ATP-binding protein FtsE [Facklamia lactis]MBG9987077.1 cell division ATP-binding protein FtsE [Facklamia lactis]